MVSQTPSAGGSEVPLLYSTNSHGLGRKATQVRSGASSLRYTSHHQDSISLFVECWARPSEHNRFYALTVSRPQIGGAFAWGRLFQWAGHFGPGFDETKYMVCAAICAAVATISEATSPPTVRPPRTRLIAGLANRASGMRQSAQLDTLNNKPTDRPTNRPTN